MTKNTTAPAAIDTTATDKDWSREQYNHLIGAGADAFTIAAAKNIVPFNLVCKWVKARQDLEAETAAYVVEEDARLAAAAAAYAALPIKASKGFNDTDLYKKSGKGFTKGEPRPATAGSMTVAGSPRFCEKCTPGQIVWILSQPATAIAIASEVNAGEHDGNGYTRTAEYDVSKQLEALADHYTNQPPPPIQAVP
jgi:hypothetical protein